MIVLHYEPVPRTMPHQTEVIVDGLNGIETTQTNDQVSIQSNSVIRRIIIQYQQ